MAMNTTTGTRTVVGFFDNADQANRAAAELERAGISRSAMNVISERDLGNYANSGSGAGGLGRGNTGPEIAGGAAAGGLGSAAGILSRAGIPPDEARYYTEGIRRGGVVLTANTPAAQAERAADIMDNNGAIDLDDRRGQSNGTEGEQTIPVVEERLKVGKRETGRGGVRVYTEISEQPVEEQVTLREEHVHVERRPADRPATEADFHAFREGTIELTETREVPVVSKEARVVEEVVVNKDVTQRTETVRDTVRRTDVRVDYDQDFRNDYQTRYGRTGRGYDYYAPGYEYGSTAASDDRYRDAEWSSAEPHIRRDWESRGHGKWEEFKDTIRHGWDRVRGRR